MPNAPKLGRKLLVATVGLATVSYLACGSETRHDTSSGNLMAPDCDATADCPDTRFELVDTGTLDTLDARDASDTSDTSDSPDAADASDASDATDIAAESEDG